MKLPKNRINRLAIFALFSSIAPILIESMGAGIAHGGEFVLLFLVIVCPSLLLNVFLSLNWLFVVIINAFYLEGLYKLYWKFKEYRKNKQ